MYYHVGISLCSRWRHTHRYIYCVTDLESFNLLRVVTSYHQAMLWSALGLGLSNKVIGNSSLRRREQRIVMTHIHVQCLQPLLWGLGLSNNVIKNSSLRRREQSIVMTQGLHTYQEAVTLCDALVGEVQLDTLLNHHLLPSLLYSPPGGRRTKTK